MRCVPLPHSVVTPVETSTVWSSTHLTSLAHLLPSLAAFPLQNISTKTYLTVVRALEIVLGIEVSWIIQWNCGHFGTLEIVLSIEVPSIQRLDNTVELLYCGHFGTLEIVLSIEVSSIQRLDNISIVDMYGIVLSPRGCIC